MPAESAVKAKKSRTMADKTIADVVARWVIAAIVLGIATGASSALVLIAVQNAKDIAVLQSKVENLPPPMLLSTIDEVKAMVKENGVKMESLAGKLSDHRIGHP